MASLLDKDKGEVAPLEELLDVEKALKNYGAELEILKSKQVYASKKEQEKVLANYVFQLKEAGETNIQAKLTQFAKDYQKTKEANAAKALKDQYKQEIKNVTEYYKERSKFAKKEEDKKDKQLQRELEIAKLLSEEGKSSDQAKKDTAKADIMQTADAIANANKDLGKNMLKGLAGLGDKLSGEINSTISAYSQYQSAINTRLQGTAQTFQSVEKKLTSTLGMSPYVKTSTMLENLNALVAQGIAYNVEQRAFLLTMKDKIATTFDVANASLLRIVKLQQEDSSASRLGMEAYLTRYFNEMFEDTQYLSQTFDNVTSALVEATSLMGTKQSVEFEYIVQKWLGSLSAVGTSESTVQSLAEALGYLGSGNVSALSGSTMQNLLVMAASRAGLDYSSILTEGLNAANTNTLLQAVVGYMQEIGSGSSNVVKSQYAKTFGLTVSDLQAAGNLEVADISTINKNMMSYGDTISELGYQLDQVSSRVSVAEKIQNLMSNIKFGVGQGIAQSPVMAGMWSITDLIQGVTGGIAIPAISVMGNMVDLNTTVENLIKTGLVGISTLGKMGDLFNGLNNSVNMSSLVDKLSLGTLTSTRRGSGLSSRSGGLTTSLGTFIGTSSGSEIASQTMMAAQTEAKSVAEQKKSETIEKSTTDIYKYLLDMFDPKMNSLLTMIGSMSGYNVGVSSFDNGKENRDYVFNYGTSVTVSAPKEDTVKTDRLNELAQNVANIYAILQSGTINVRIANQAWPLS